MREKKVLTMWRFIHADGGKRHVRHISPQLLVSLSPTCLDKALNFTKHLNLFSIKVVKCTHSLKSISRMKENEKKKKREKKQQLFIRGPAVVSRCVVFFDLQYKNQRYSVYKDLETQTIFMSDEQQHSDLWPNSLVFKMVATMMYSVTVIYQIFILIVVLVSLFCHLTIQQIESTK